MGYSATHCYVYVLGSRDAGAVRTYVGWTTDLDRRLAEHNAGTGARSTRGRRWTLLYAERYPTRPDAMRREWRLKRDRRFRKHIAESLIPETVPDHRSRSGRIPSNQRNWRTRHDSNV